MPKVCVLKSETNCYNCNECKIDVSEWEDVTEAELLKIKDYARKSKGLYHVLEKSTVDELKIYYATEILKYIKAEEKYFAAKKEREKKIAAKRKINIEKKEKQKLKELKEKYEAT